MDLYLKISVLILSYLLGSIPFGYILTRLAGLGDIRKTGSGNIGATNVLRSGNKILAGLTLLLDMMKGAAATLLVGHLYPEMAPMAGLLAVVGHIFPVWLDFKGGKGVATAIGVLTALAWKVGLSVMAAWILTAVILEYSSMASLISLFLSPMLMIVFGYFDYMWISVCLLMLIVWKHTPNIQRLREGTEPKIGKPYNAANNEPPSA